MTTNFMLQLAKSLEQCPKCHKITLDNSSTLDISPNKIVRRCQCGYCIEISIKEYLNNLEPEPERKILLENDKSNIVSEPPKIINMESMIEKPEKLTNVTINESTGIIEESK